MSDLSVSFCDTIHPCQKSFLSGLSGRRYQMRDIDDTPVTDIPGVSKTVVELVKARGVSDITTFFDAKIKTTAPEPLSVLNMSRVLDMIYDAVTMGRRIGFIGDYDVDGATSTAEMVLWLRDMGLQSDFIIPQRMTDGYGANTRLIDEMQSRGVCLLVILDSGTASHEPIAYARGLGMEVIVVDHHKPGPDWQSPDAVVINPHQPGDDSGLTYMCTAGLVMVLLMGLNRHFRQQGWSKTPLPDLMGLMGLAALGTVADIMPLLDFNRALVRTGLLTMARNPGLQALLEACGIDEPVTARHLGFRLGPCINAGGRLGDCMQGVTLLTTTDEGERTSLAQRLFDTNRERQELQRGIEAEAYAQIGEAPEDGVIVVQNDGWHHGVVGIVAARVREKYDRPAIVLGGGCKGSGRSAHGFDLGTAIIEARNSGLLLSGGGHAAAVGMTVAPGRLDDLRAHLNAAAQGLKPLPLPLDISMGMSSVRPAMLESLAALEPTGTGNEMPVFLFNDVILSKVTPSPKGHVSFELRDETGYRIGGIMFQAAGTVFERYMTDHIGLPISCVGSLDEWLGRPKLKITDILDL